MAVITICAICSDFGAQKNKVNHCFHCFPMSFPWSDGTYSVTKLCPTLCDPITAAHQPSLSFTISRSLLKPMSIESVMLFNYLILCHPLLFLPSIFSSIRVFCNESTLHMSPGASALASVLPMNIQRGCRGRGGDGRWRNGLPGCAWNFQSFGGLVGAGH